MFPRTLALVEDEGDYREYLATHLRSLGIATSTFASGEDLITDPQGFAFEFYVVDLGLQGLDGLDLIRLLRRRSSAGILVVSGRLGGEVFEQIVLAGGDMYLTKPVQFDQVALAVRAVHRRAVLSMAKAEGWRLLRATRQLVAPDGASVELSEADLALLECFVGAVGATVTRETLHARLGHSAGESAENTLTATVYRLRRRIERATPLAVPLHAQPRLGYVFKAPLTAV
ncbi:response regulator transcription factor [Aquabacterium sp.]|uniref:response regulator transcription factor n=1 Tax=Aquabacterium sp. TaxID=1872578 RepID=UPI0037850A07